MKYVLFGIALLAFIIEKFTKTSKSEKSPFQESTRIGKILIFVSFIALMLGVWQTFQSDRASDLQTKSLEKNITKLNYPLPYSIKFNFNFSYNLDKKKDSLIIAYLDSLSIGKDKDVYKKPDSTKGLNSPGIYYFDYKILNTQKIHLIDEIIYFLLAGRFDFVLNKEPLLRLKATYVWKPNTDYKFYSDFKKKMDFVYDKFKKKVSIYTHNNIFFDTDQQRKVGITSLMDLENSFLFISSFSFYGCGFDEERVWLNLDLQINDRSIYFQNLIPFSASKENIEVLRKHDIYTIDMPVFFLYDISEETLRGNLKSLKYKDPNKFGEIDK